MIDLEKADQNISDLCDYIDRMNKPNPENPGGISELAYHTVMTNFHYPVDLDEPIEPDYPYGEWDLIEQHTHNMKEYLDCCDLKNEEENIVMFGGIN